MKYKKSQCHEGRAHFQKILDVKDNLVKTLIRYTKTFMLISLLEVCQEWGSRRGVLGGYRWFLSRDIEGRFIHDIMYYLILPQGRFPESFILKSLLIVWQK